MSILKFVGEQDKDRHGGPLQWPGLFDLPMRGDVGLLRDAELDEFFEETCDFHCETFDLSDPVQVKQYTEVMDRILNGGWYVQIYVERWRDADTGKRFVYMEWAQRYGQINPKAKARVALSQPTRSPVVEAG